MKLKNLSPLFLFNLWLAGLLFAVAPLRAADETMDQPGHAIPTRQLHFLAPDAVSAATLLCPPPLPDSAEQAADLNEVRAVYHAATSNEIAAAYSEKKFSIFTFMPVIGDFFQSNNLPKTTAFFEKVQMDAETVTDLGEASFSSSAPLHR